MKYTTQPTNHLISSGFDFRSVPPLQSLTHVALSTDKAIGIIMGSTTTTTPDIRLSTDLISHLQKAIPQDGTRDSLLSSVIPSLLKSVAEIARDLQSSHHVSAAGTSNIFGDDRTLSFSSPCLRPNYTNLNPQNSTSTSKPKPTSVKPSPPVPPSSPPPAKKTRSNAPLSTPPPPPPPHATKNTPSPSTP